MNNENNLNNTDSVLNEMPAEQIIPSPEPVISPEPVVETMPIESAPIAQSSIMPEPLAPVNATVQQPVFVEPTAVETVPAMEPSNTMDILENNEPAVSEETATVAPVQTEPIIEPLAPDPSTLDPSLPSLDSITPSNSSNNYSNEPITFAKKKTSGLKAILIIVLLLIFAGGGYFAYTYFFVKAEDIHKVAVQKFLNKASVSISNVQKNFVKVDKTGKLLITGNLSFETDNEQFKPYTIYGLGYSLGLDGTANKSQTSLSISENGQELLDVYAYIINNSAFFKSDKLYSKIVKYASLPFDLTASDYLELLNVEDYKYVTDQMSNYIVDSLDVFNYEKNNSKVTINGKTEMAVESVATINMKSMQALLKKVLTSIKGDSRMLLIICDLVNSTNSNNIESPEQITEYINQMLPSLDEEPTDDSTIKISVYTSYFTNKLMAIRCINEDNEGFTYDVLSDSSVLKITASDNIQVLVTFKGQITEFAYTENGETMISGKYNNTNNGSIFDLTQGTNTVKMESSYTKPSEDTVNYDIKVTVNAEEMSGTIKLNGKVTTAEEVANVDVTSAIALEKLTQTDYTTILGNLDKSLKNSSLYPVISQYISSTAAELQKSNVIGKETNPNSNTEKNSNDKCSVATDCISCNGTNCSCKYTTSTGFERILCPDTSNKTV